MKTHTSITQNRRPAEMRVHASPPRKNASSMNPAKRPEKTAAIASQAILVLALASSTVHSLPRPTV